MKEKNIQELAKRMGLVTVEDMCQYTIAQLVVKIANKVNELVDEVWRFETDVQEILKTQNENIQYLLGEGLHLEVENIFDGWTKDGTFDTLINHSALKSVNDRIDETNAQLSEKANKNTVLYLKDYVKGMSTSDYSGVIQNMINDLPQNGGTIFINRGKYPLKTIINVNKSLVITGEVDSYLQCQGGGFVTDDDVEHNMYVEHISWENSSTQPCITMIKTTNPNAYENIYIFNCRFYDKGATEQVTMLKLRTSTSTINSCYFQSNGRSGCCAINYVRGMNVNITNCKFIMLGMGVLLGSHDVAYEQNGGYRIMNNLFLGGHRAIVAYNCDSLAIEKNMMDWQKEAITVDFSLNCKIRNNYISSTDNTSACINILNTNTTYTLHMRGLEISSNYLASYGTPKSKGIVLNPTSFGLSFANIHDNFFRRLSTAVDFVGLDSAKISRCQISNNTCDNSDKFINLSNNTVLNVISRNIVDDANVAVFSNNNGTNNKFDGMNVWGSKYSENKFYFDISGDGGTKEWSIPHSLFGTPSFCNITVSNLIDSPQSTTNEFYFILDENNINLKSRTAINTGNKYRVYFDVRL